MQKKYIILSSEASFAASHFMFTSPKQLFDVADLLSNSGKDEKPADFAVL